MPAPEELAAMDRIITEQAGIVSQAKELMDYGYHPINAHGIIGLWVAVEVAIEDTAVLVLTKDAQAAQEAISALKKKPKLAGQALGEPDARRIFDRLQRQFREGKTVAEGYRLLLQALKIEMTISDKSANVLSELNYVRNCLLHRGGMADERAALEAPNLGLTLGDSICINGARYLQYFDAASEFARALLNAVLKSPYIRVRQ